MKVVSTYNINEKLLRYKKHNHFSFHLYPMPAQRCQLGWMGYCSTNTRAYPGRSNSYTFCFNQGGVGKFAIRW